MEIRCETKDDYAATEAIARDAFWNLYQPGADEHYVLHALRRSSDYLPGLCFTATQDGVAVGHVACSSSRITSSSGSIHSLPTIGPVCVAPQWQGKGIGTALLRAVIAAAKDKGHIGLLLLGFPGYYSRFGFHNAQEYGITMPDGSNPKGFQALELQPGSLSGVSGVYSASPAFDVDASKAKAFDSQFPQRLKFVTKSQKAFGMIVALRHDEDIPEYAVAHIWDKTPVDEGSKEEEKES